MLSRFLPIIIALLLISLGAFGGFLAGSRMQPKSVAPVDPLASFFNTQSATVRGTIIKKDGDTLTVKNTKGATQTFGLSKEATISKFDANKNLSSPSADLKELTLNKEAILTLRKATGTFKVVAVSYLP